MTDKNPLHEKKLFLNPADGLRQIATAINSDIPIVSNIAEVNAIDPAADADMIEQQVCAAKIEPGYMVIYQPLFRQAEQGETSRQLVCVIAAQAPGPNVFSTNATAASWAFDAAVEKLVRILKSSASDIQKGVEGSTMPVTLEQFFEAGGRDRGLTEVNDVIGDFVRQLRAANFTGLTKEQLKMCLQSRAFADAIYPPRFNAVWVHVLNQMRDAIKARGGTASLVETWIRTRDERVASLERDIDLKALGISLDETEAA